MLFETDPITELAENYKEMHKLEVRCRTLVKDYLIVLRSGVCRERGQVLLEEITKSFGNLLVACYGESRPQELQNFVVNLRLLRGDLDLGAPRRAVWPDELFPPLHQPGT
jgi:hypothetical protein